MEPNKIYTFEYAEKLAHEELKIRGMGAEPWAFDIKRLQEERDHYADYDYVRLEDWGNNAFGLSEEDAEEYFNDGEELEDFEDWGD